MPKNAATPTAPAEPVSRQRLIVGLALAIGITLISGMLHGRMSQRWGMDERMADAALRLEAFPEQIGVWQQESSYELGKSAIELLECQGYIQRGYRNLETGDYVKLSVMVGPGSKISIHIPEICYEASNFSLLGPRERFEVSLKGNSHAFWGVTFQVNDVSERQVRVLYGWSTGGAWQAPRLPRWSVAGYPVLYKLQLSYVMNDLRAVDSAASDALMRDFLQEVLPILDRQMADTTSNP